MKVIVSFYGQPRHVAGVEKEQLEVDDSSTVISVIKIVAAKYGDNLLSMIFTEDGQLRSSFVLPVNDEVAEIDQVLNDGDEVSIYPAMSGG